MQSNRTVDPQHRECGLELRVEHLRATDHTTTVGAARVSNESPVLEASITPVGVSAVLPVQALVSKLKSASASRRNWGVFKTNVTRGPPPQSSLRVFCAILVPTKSKPTLVQRAVYSGSCSAISVTSSWVNSCIFYPGVSTAEPLPVSRFLTFVRPEIALTISRTMGVAFSIAPAALPANRVKRLRLVSMLSIDNQMGKNERELGIRSVLD